MDPLTAINLQNKSPEQIFLLFHKLYMVPFLELFYVVYVIIGLIVGLSLIKNVGNNPYKKYFIIWIVTTIIMGIALVFFIIAPDTIKNILSLFVNFN